MALLVLVHGCSAKRVVTVDQVKEIVGSKVFIGSSKEEVVAFVEALRIDSLRVTHSEGAAELLRYDNFDDEKKNALGDKLDSFYDAAIRDIAPSTTTFEAVIKMRFYFDENRKLLDCTIKEDGGFR